MIETERKGEDGGRERGGRERGGTESKRREGLLYPRGKYRKLERERNKERNERESLVTAKPYIHTLHPAYYILSQNYMTLRIDPIITLKINPISISIRLSATALTCA